MLVYVTLSIFGFLIAVYIIVAFLTVRFAITPRKRPPEELREVELGLKKVDPALYEIPFSELSLKSDFGYDIYARGYFNENSDKYVVILHGHNSASSGTVRFMKIFRDRGYNVILPDNRYSAKTGGDFISFGYFEKHDAIKSIEYIHTINKNASIGIMGESMGGATALMVAGLRDDLKFCIDYCGYSSAEGAFKDKFRKLHLPRVLLCLPLVRLIIRKKHGFNICDVRPAESARNIKCPLLVMHSKKDMDVRYYHHKIILDNAKDAEHISFENASHGCSLTMYPEEFTDGINKFLNKVGF
ncbi:MAG: alpha/beta hydrolase [Treponema sp.]|jgi:dipeptidyl aminopeptidase/acylaminoacyl peptidase|nr:alpha/beta hydrolase [Treponema sp.]